MRVPDFAPKKRSVQGGLRLAAFLAGVALATPVAALRITTEYNPPFNFQQGSRITGIATDILLEMGRRSGVQMEIEILPWARAYQSALHTPDTCVYSTVRMPEREHSFAWIGPLATNKWALFARSDFNRHLGSIEDARPYRIGGVTQDAKVLYLKSLGFSNVDMVGDDRLNAGKLIAGRIDLWITGLYKEKGADPANNGKRIKPVLVVREVDYYLACNPKTSKATLFALERAFKSLQKEGYVRTAALQYAEWLR